MDRQAFLDRTPYLYHLTDVNNTHFIQRERAIYSTNRLLEIGNIPNSEAIATTRRGDHLQINVNGRIISIRDQIPLNNYIDKCLTDNWNRAQFIHHLNNRVFLWPNLNRLNIHFGRYSHEQPVILRFNTEDLLLVNDPPELSFINSGATLRKAPMRGPNTFKLIEDFERKPREVAEVTFPTVCNLTNPYEIGHNPNGPWESVVFRK